MKRILILTITVVLLALAGCKSKEGVAVTSPGTTGDERAHYNAMIDAYGSWRTFTSKGTISIAGSSLRSTVEIRMIRGEAIQVSIRPLLGIEVGRMLITGDSIFIHDKFNKRYIAEAIDDMQSVLPMEVTAADVQNVLLGRPFVFEHDELTAADYGLFDFVMGDNEDWAMQPLQQYREFTYRFQLNKEMLMGIQAYQAGSTRQINCSYANHKATGNSLLPSFVQFTAQGSSRKYTLNINYDTSTTAWDKEFTLTKLPTAGYTIITFRQLLKSLIP